MTKFARMKAFAGGVVAVLLLLVQGACTSTSVITKENRYGFYSPDLVQYVAAQGDFPVLVIANPFGAGTDDDLLAVMQLPGFFPPTPFAATTDEARKFGHLVLVFNPIRASTGYGICTEPATQTASAPGRAGAADRMRLHATFCYSDELVSEAILEMPRPTGLDDPAFDVAMSQLMSSVLSSRGSDDSVCGDPATTNC